MLVDLAASAKLFHTPGGTAFADLARRWAPGNLAGSQHPLSDMVAASVLRSNRERRQRGSGGLGA